VDERDEVRSRIDLVSLIGDEITLKRKGKNYVGLCPFHADKNPSLTVSTDIGRYKCWSCGAGGDCFTWVMERENVEFVEALRMLAARAGVELRRERSDGRSDQKSQWLAAMNSALAFFREALGKSPEALAYCDRRGLDAEARMNWEMGYAPEVGEALAVHLKRNSIPLPVARQLFLVDQDGSGGYFDRFRGRLMFPIRNERGDLVAFGGRLLGAGQAKYINSGDTPLYQKSRVLYGLQRAKASIGRSGYAILCEGYLDVIACHRAGLTEAVASLGTALSSDHVDLLARFTDRLVVLYDSDAAGLKAAERVLETVGDRLKVRVAQMLPGEDPDSVLTGRGPQALAEVVRKPLTPTAFRLAQLEGELGLEHEDFWPRAAELLALEPNAVEAGRLATALAGRNPQLRDPRQAESALLRMIEARRPRRRRSTVPRSGAAKAEGAKLDPIELAIFRAVVTPKFRAGVWPVLSTSDLLVTGYAQALANELTRQFGDAPPPGPLNDWLHHLPAETQDALATLALHDHEIPLSETAVVEAIKRLQANREMRQARLLKESNEVEKISEAFDRLKRRHEAMSFDEPRPDA
jgi:DNA primase